jgi:hypothetical protein
MPDEKPVCNCVPHAHDIVSHLDAYLQECIAGEVIRCHQLAGMVTALEQAFPEAMIGADTTLLADPVPYSPQVRNAIDGNDDASLTQLITDLKTDIMGVSCNPGRRLLRFHRNQQIRREERSEALGKEV